MVPPELQADSLLTALLDYWERQRGDCAMPRRKDIDPLDLPRPLLPFIEIVERGVEDRLRWRLVGTAIVDAMGKDTTGRYLDQALDGSYRQFIEHIHRTAMGAQRPVYAVCRLGAPGGSAVAARLLVAPLAVSGTEAAMTIGATRFAGGYRRVLAPPLSACDVEDERIEIL